MMLVAESAGAAAVRICVPDALDASARDELLIALRKAGVQPTLSCERPALRVDVEPDGIALRIGGQSVSLHPGEPSSVAQAARWVADRGAGDGRSAPPLGRTIHVRLPEPPATAGPPPRGLASLGAAWSFETGTRAHLGSLHARAGIELLGGTLQVFCGGGWTPSHAGERGDFSWTRDAGEVLIGAGGGLWFGPVRVSLSAEGGWQWRTADLNIATRRSTLSLESDSGFAGGELEAALALGQHLRLALALAGRGYFGGTEYAWGSEPVLEAPEGAVLLSLRAWAVFP